MLCLSSLICEFPFHNNILSRPRGDWTDPIIKLLQCYGIIKLYMKNCIGNPTLLLFAAKSLKLLEFSQNKYAIYPAKP